MNYYPLNIGDYLAHTCHLTHMEDLAYFRLINHYYLSEKPIKGTIAEIAKSIRMNDNATEIQYVLNEFFIEEDGLWLNKRCDKEILIYKGKQKQSSLAGIASGIARRNAGSTGVQPDSLKQTINNKQETINNNKDSTPLKLLSINYKIPKQTAKDYIALRNKKNAPVTATSINMIEKEAQKAGVSLEAALKLCIENSWRGFKADWLKTDKVSQSKEKIVDWRTTEDGVKAKGVELKIYPNTGESLKDYRQRLLKGEK